MLHHFDIYEDRKNGVFQVRTKTDVYAIEFQDEEKAALFVTLAGFLSQGFAHQLGSWGYDKTSNSVAKKLRSAKLLFSPELKQRIELTQIECNDAVRVIQGRDRVGAFHYADPPYFNSNCGHYSGYTVSDFERLLETLSQVKGQFLLSSYESEVLSEWTRRQGWETVTFTKPIAVHSKVNRNKVEVLTANYSIR